MGSVRVLTHRELNRALLARQGLLERWSCPPLEAIERLVGMQSQAPLAPYVGLWSRLTSFEPDELGQLMLSRDAVRIVLMRSTIFLVSARDCVDLRPVMQPAAERGLSFVRGRHPGIPEDEVVTVSEALLRAEPRTFKSLGIELARHFPDHNPDAMVLFPRGRLPLVQITPRGVWGSSKAATHVLADDWLGTPLAPSDDPRPVIQRYLAAFGPASVADVATWSGLTKLGPVLESMRPQLRVFRDESGRELFDVPDGLLPSADTPVGARILPEFDNILLGHADRGRLYVDAQQIPLMAKNGLMRPTLLLDGLVRGIIAVRTQKDSAAVTVTPFGRLTRKQQNEAEREIRQMVAFTSGPGVDPTVEFVAPLST